MRIDVLKTLRLKLVRTAAVAGLAGLAAGCSSDVARFDDGFYTGAVPKAPLTRTASLQPYPGDINQASTGDLQTAAGSPGTSAYPSANAGYRQQNLSQAYGSAPSTSVQSNQLPPPPQSTSVELSGSARSEMTSTAAPQRSEEGSPGIGAPPSTLQEQARHVSLPQARPAHTSSPSGRTAEGGSVKVGSGDTLLAISRRTGVSVAEIKRANNLSGDMVRLGQTLIVPGASENTKVASLSPSTPSRSVSPAVETKAENAPEPYTPPKTAEKSGRPAAETAAKEAEPTSQPTTMKDVAEEKVAVAAPTATGISGFRWPAQGRVVNRFGEKVGSRRNDGLNISVPRGTPIKAAENGVVIYAGDGLKEFGNTVLVQHDDGLVTVYGHAEKLEVKRGAKVTRGQEIAKSGMSGDTDVPIVHFEVRKNSTPVDPKKYLQ